MQIRISRWLVSLIIIGTLLVGGCTSQETSSQATQNSSATTPISTTQANNPQMTNLPRLEGKATVVMTVKDSPITIEVDGTNAPITAGNFVDLVERGVYKGLVFHRVEKNFVVQGGDPKSIDTKLQNQWGTGGFIDPETKQPRNIPLEIKPTGADTPIYSKTFESARISQPPVLAHKRGAVAMARSMSPDSASSQFYFALSDIHFLDGNYAVFGYVTQGMDVVDKIAVGDKIESAKVTQGAENLKK